MAHDSGTYDQVHKVDFLGQQPAKSVKPNVGLAIGLYLLLVIIGLIATTLALTGIISSFWVIGSTLLLVFAGLSIQSVYWRAEREHVRRLLDELLDESQSDRKSGSKHFLSNFDELATEYSNLRSQHKLIVTHIAAAVVIRNSTGEIKFCSPYTEVLTGYGLDELMEMGEDFFETLVIEEDRERYRRAMMVASLAEDISVKYRIRHRSGIQLWLETRLVPVCDINGELTSIMGVSIDVSDTLTYQRQIEQQNRDLSDFAYMVSHDLKAPIFTIKGMAAALLEDHGDSLGTDGCGLLNYIVDATKRLELLVSSVIEYSSIATKSTETQDVDLNEIFAQVLADQSELIRSKDGVVELPPELPVVRGNPIRVYQVFSNLIGNAFKYSAVGRRPIVSVSVLQQGAGIAIDVQDNGRGIPKSNVEDIFRPYQRANHGDVEGSGIGLACVMKIMDKLGGTVSVETEEGKGSTFRIVFPAVVVPNRTIPSDLARVFI